MKNIKSMSKEDFQNRIPSKEFNNNFLIRRLISDFQKNVSYTPTTQFFLAPSVFSGENIKVEIPTLSNEIYEQVINEIAPHFNMVKVSESDGLKTVILSDITDISKKAFGNLSNFGDIHPIINEIYGSGEDMLNTYQDNLYFSIELKNFNGLRLDSFDDAWDLLKNTYIKANGVFAFIPSNWHLTEKLLIESITLNYLYLKCKDIILSVNSNSYKINAVYLFC
jgi:hypothetical protein